MPENLLLLILSFLLIFILAIFKKQLTFELQGISLLVFNTPKPGRWFYTLLFLPGTILHELSHWLMAEALQVRTGKIQIFPEEKAEKEEKSLGSIETIKTDPLRGFLIGMAPLITGTAAIVALAGLLGDIWGASAPFWQTALLVYAVIVFSNSMLTSKSDKRYWPLMAALTLGTYWLLKQIKFTPPDTFANFLNQALSSINSSLVLALLLELGLIILLFILRLGLEKLFDKKVRKS